MKSLFHSSGMEWWVYLLLVPAGFLAGFINTLAGSGSVISLFVLNDLVRWIPWLTLACGSMLGAWAATHEAAVRGAQFIRRLLIAVVLASAIRYLFF
jgi:uncharacterized membrane protein YfcA